MVVMAGIESYRDFDYTILKFTNNLEHIDVSETVGAIVIRVT